MAPTPPHRAGRFEGLISTRGAPDFAEGFVAEVKRSEPISAWRSRPPLPHRRSSRRGRGRPRLTWRTTVPFRDFGLAAAGHHAADLCHGGLQIYSATPRYQVRRCLVEAGSLGAGRPAGHVDRGPDRLPHAARPKRMSCYFLSIASLVLVLFIGTKVFGGRRWIGYEAFICRSRSSSRR